MKAATRVKALENTAIHVKMVAATVSLVALIFTTFAVKAADGISPAPSATTQVTQCSKPGDIWWNELLTPDTRKLTNFYAKVLGWRQKVVDVHDQRSAPLREIDRYTIFSAQTGQQAGLMDAKHPDAAHTSNGWFLYVHVKSVSDTIASARSNGGTIIRDLTEVDNMGEVAVIRDPMGNVFGIITPTQKARCRQQTSASASH